MTRSSRAAIAMAGAAHLAVVLSVVLQEHPVIGSLHNDTIHRAGRAADFNAVYHAGLNLREGRNPYDAEPDGVTPYFYPFRYLPVLAYAAQPLSLLTPGAAYLVWVVLLEVLLGILLAVLWRQLQPPGLRLAVILVLLLSSPFFLEVYMGQFTFAALALCALALTVRRGSGLLVASVLLKPVALATLPALLRHRERWPLAGAMAAGVLLAAGPYFLAHRDQWVIFFDSNFLITGGYHAGNFGLVHLLHLVAEDVLPALDAGRWAVAAGAWRLLVLGGTALVVLVARRQEWRLGVPALLLAHFLTFAHVWEHHLSGVVVLGAVALTVPGLKTSRRWAMWACLVLLALPTPHFFFDSARDPAIWDPAQNWPRYASYLTALAKVLPTAGLYGLILGEVVGAGLGFQFSRNR